MAGRATARRSSALASAMAALSAAGGLVRETRGEDKLQPQRHAVKLSFTALNPLTCGDMRQQRAPGDIFLTGRPTRILVLP